MKKLSLLTPLILAAGVLCSSSQFAGAAASEPVKPFNGKNLAGWKAKLKKLNILQNNLSKASEVQEAEEDDGSPGDAEDA